jgi:hypothetical protein
VVVAPPPPTAVAQPAQSTAPLIRNQGVQPCTEPMALQLGNVAAGRAVSAVTPSAPDATTPALPTQRASSGFGATPLDRGEGVALPAQAALPPPPCAHVSTYTLGDQRAHTTSMTAVGAPTNVGGTEAAAAGVHSGEGVTAMLHNTTPDVADTASASSTAQAPQPLPTHSHVQSLLPTQAPCLTPPALSALPSSYICATATAWHIPPTSSDPCAAAAAAAAAAGGTATTTAATSTSSQGGAAALPGSCYPASGARRLKPELLHEDDVSGVSG